MRLKIKTFKFKISLLGKKTKVFCLFVFYFWLCILVIFFKVTINYIILKFSQLSFIGRAKYDVKQVIQLRDCFVVIYETWCCMTVYLTFKGLCRGSLSIWQSRPLRNSKPSWPSFILEKHVGFEASSCDDRIDLRIPWNTDVYQNNTQEYFHPYINKIRGRRNSLPRLSFFASKLTQVWLCLPRSWWRGKRLVCRWPWIIFASKDSSSSAR